MAVDISTDLTITLLAKDIATPTITGLYDAGSPSGTYVPGKDFSPVDNVSTGVTAQLNFSIAFDSLSNQLYTLDKVYIQSVDAPRTDGTGLVPGRWINQNPDPTDIVDDGLNTVILNYNASMSSIVFDSTANIKSDSTLTTGITLTLPTAFWWKSKLMPKIRVVAEKDGFQKISEPLQLPSILLSTAGVLHSNLSPGGNIGYQGPPGVLGFYDSIRLVTLKESVPNIAGMRDDPDYDLITYQVAYAPTVNGTAISLTAANFSIPFVNNGTLESKSYAGGVLTVVARQTAPGTVGMNVSVFIPFDATGLTQATVSVTGTWNVNPPTITGFVNAYLFTQIADGSASRTVVVDTSGQPPVQKPFVQNAISATLQGKMVSQTLTVANYPCFRPQSSIILRMIDSQVASFGPDVAPLYSFFDVNTGAVGGPMPAGSYTALYGHYDFPAGYDPNALAQAILTGAIPMTDHASVVGVPNLMTVILVQDLYAGHTVDYSKQANFQFTGGLDVLTQAEFASLYQSDPKDSYPTHIYNYMALNTCYGTPAEGYAAVGSVLSGVDAFRTRNGLVYLDLGTTALPAAISVQRFGTTSFVRTDVPLDTIDAFLAYGVTTMSGVEVGTVTDYTKTYCVMFRWGYVPGADSAFIHIPSGTKFTVTLPGVLLPYLYLAGMPYLQVPVNGLPPIQVPITQYALSGNQLTITLPADADMQPDAVCVPVKFLTPSQDLTSTLESLAWDRPLVYTQDPNSLLYGFTTDSLLYRVTGVTRAFTLKGAQLDTTGLSVFPSVYERGQAVTYISTVYNLSYAPDSDYCMAMTVPTNQYNPVESSNNVLTAHITGINLTNPGTVLYFQTAANVTALDIQVVKSLNVPGVPTLQAYFDAVVVNAWTRYTGQVLPAGVVLLMACTPDVPQNSLVRVDYNVVMDVPAGENTLFTNDAVFNYYSSGANLEAQSNMVTIRNRVAEALPIVKSPPVQIYPLQNGVKVAFDAYFTAPLDPLIFQNFTVTDVLHSSLSLDLADVSLVVYPNTPVPYTKSFDPATHTLTVTVDNTTQTVGRVLALHIGATVTDISVIPVDPVYQLPLFYNTATLTVNHNPQLRADSEPVIVAFQPAPPAPVPIVKAPQDQVKPRANDTPVTFTLTFTAPAAVQVYTHFTITDTLHPALALTGVGATADGSGIPISSQYDPATGLVTVDFDNNALTAGKTIVLTLDTVVSDVTKLPADNVIENAARLTLNRDSALYDDSNTVTVRFPMEPGRCRAITDLVASVAMEQAALAHILNAEGEKLQKALTMPLTPAQLLEVNRSVGSMVNSVTLLEHVLNRKIETVDCGLCGEC